MAFHLYLTAEIISRDQVAEKELLLVFCCTLSHAVHTKSVKTTPESSVLAEAADKAAENAESKVCQEPSHNTFDSLAF